MAEPFIGEIQILPYSFAPRCWAYCDGSLLQISQHTILYALIGDTYGGNGRSTMALPNLQGHTTIGQGRGPGLDDGKIAEKGGVENITSVVEHTHTTSSSGAPEIPLGTGKGTQGNAAGGYLADGSCDVPISGTTAPANFYCGSTGTQTIKGNDLQVEIIPSPDVNVSNMQPFLVMNYCIAMDGMFPSRS